MGTWLELLNYNVIRETYERGNDDSNQQRDNIRPNWKGNVLFENNDEAHDEADDKYQNVPPPCHLFIMLAHVVMVPIVESTFPCALISPLDILAPEKDAVDNKSANLERQISLSARDENRITYCSICHKHRERERSSKLGQAITGQSCLVEYTTGEHVVDGIRRAIAPEHSCGHERKRSRIPAVAVIDA